MSPLAVGLACAVVAQAPPPAFGTGVEGVYVDVFVTEGSRPVLGLGHEDFELRDNGVRRRAELVGIASAPLSVSLVLDSSSSVAGEKLVQLRAAARALLGGLAPDDEASLVTFDEEVSVRVPPTRDRARLEQGVSRIQPGGATAVFDALYAGTMLASDRGRTLLVLFTDGEDNVSWLDASRVQRVLLESNVLVQVVGIVPGRGEIPFEPTTDTERLAAEAPYVATLRRFAEATGGRFWAASAPEGLENAFLAILAAMKTRYILRFEPDRARRVGLHKLEVKLRRGKGQVHCRKAYFIGPLAQ